MSLNFETLMRYIQTLRQSNDAGCSWTQAQTLETLLPQTLDEVYELIHAYHHQSHDAFDAELGDLLYHVAFYCVIALENEPDANCHIGERIRRVIEKHESRLPPATERARYTPEQINQYWQTQKQKAGQAAKASIAANAGLPPMRRAEHLQRAAASLGFDWPSHEGVMAKLDEEVDELKAELVQAGNKQRVQEELGDILFTCINLARHLGLDAEMALHGANEKFVTRFARVQQLALAQSVELKDASLKVLEQLWQQAKREQGDESNSVGQHHDVV